MSDPLSSQQEFALEQTHLMQILSIVQAQLDAADQGSEANHEALVQARRELHQQAEQMFTNLWGSDDFENLANLNQLAQPLAVRQKTHEMELEHIGALVRMQDVPYFARVDFTFDDDDDTEQIYIGRATLKDEKTHDLYVHDWRSPIASVFYRFGVGPASYEAPAGKITGQVRLKRQYEIRHGVLDYFFDADVQIQDEFLRKLLGKNASPRMKAIVETIQRDQDIAIRDTSHDLLMVQGVAGSGKTSIALHRVAYLMYEGLSTRLLAHNILILSPNALFERYIESVLPELGERSVASTTFERLLEGILNTPVQLRNERFESLCTAEPNERARMREALKFKISSEFITILDRFVRELPRRFIAFQDVCYAGKTIATREQLKQRILKSDGAVPLGVQLHRMEMSLWDGIHERRPARLNQLIERARKNPAHQLELIAFARACSILESAQLKKHIRSFTELDCRQLLKALVSDESAFRRLAEGVELPERISEILHATQRTLDGESLPFEDAAAVAYLQLKLMGAGNQGDIRQLVVDEAQDYGPLQFAILGQLYRRARFTVLGDINQAIDRRTEMSLYDEIEHVLNKRNSALVELTKSFRCTSQILQFSLGFLNGVSIESFNRGGDKPELHCVNDAQEMEEMIIREVAHCQEAGYASIALITKTALSANAWNERLKDKLNLHLVDGAQDPQGTFVIPLALSKGLEFDAVLVLDVDAAHYNEPEDKNLLYVACTRALHRLSLFTEGEPSPYLAEEVRA